MQADPRGDSGGTDGSHPGALTLQGAPPWTEPLGVWATLSVDPPLASRRLARTSRWGETLSPCPEEEGLRTYTLNKGAAAVGRDV